MFTADAESVMKQVLIENEIRNPVRPDDEVKTQFGWCPGGGNTKGHDRAGSPNEHHFRIAPPGCLHIPNFTPYPREPRALETCVLIKRQARLRSIPNMPTLDLAQRRLP